MSGNYVMARLLTAQQYFSLEQAVFDALSSAAEKRERIEEFRSGNGFISLLGIIGFVVYCWKYFFSFFDWFTERSTVVNNIFLHIIGSVLPHFLVIILWVVSMFFCFIILYGIGFGIVILGVEMIKKMLTEPFYKRQLAETDKKIEELASIYQKYESNIGDTCPIPFDRCHPVLIGQLIEVILSGRADTVKDAINLIIQDEHNQKMLALGEQQVKNLQQANAYLKEISKNTRSIAWNTFWN
jgi:hypothetical protein